MLAFSITWAQGDSLAWEAKIIKLRLEAIHSSVRKLTYSFAWSAQLTPQRVSFARNHTRNRAEGCSVALPQMLSSSAEELSSDFARCAFQLRCELDAGSSTAGPLWSTFDQLNLQMRSNLIRIKIKSNQDQTAIRFGSWLPWSLDSPKTSKRIKGDLPIIWKGSKQIRRPIYLLLLAS